MFSSALVATFIETKRDLLLNQDEMNRADKSGFAAEAQNKACLVLTPNPFSGSIDFFHFVGRFQIHSKFDPELAGQILRWVQQNSGESFSTDGDVKNFCEVLKDGTVLCRWLL